MIACLTYKILSTDQLTYMRALLHYYTPQCIGTLSQPTPPLATRQVPLNLANDLSITLHLKQGPV